MKNLVKQFFVSFDVTSMDSKVQKLVVATTAAKTKAKLSVGK